MASLDELDRTWPAKYTLANHTLIVMARVREDIVYFFDQLGPTTTIILLAEPDCYELKYVFLEFMISIGATVIDLREKETFDVNYKMSKKSFDIIKAILTQYDYDQIITHPRYSRDNDSQNREIFDVVSTLINVIRSNNHYTYNKIGTYGYPDIPKDGSLKKNMLLLYSKAAAKDDLKAAKRLYDNYVSISSHISGIIKI
jgi:hypothetical protein